MIELHPEILSKNGKREFVVLPYEEFMALQEELEDLEDLRQLDEAIAKEKHTPSSPCAEATKQLGVDWRPEGFPGMRKPRRWVVGLCHKFRTGLSESGKSN